MTEQKVKLDHICDETLVSDFIDNRMDETDRNEYLKKIENCIFIRKCNHCKKLIKVFLSIKKNCMKLNRKDTMPPRLENKLINRIHSSYKSS